MEFGTLPARNAVFRSTMASLTVRPATKPRRVTAHRGRTQRDGDEAGLALVLQNLLAHGLVLGIVGERLERQVFGDVGLVLDAVDRGRGGVDEALDAGILARLHQRPEA